MASHPRRSSAFILVFVLVCMTVIIISLVAMVQRLTISQRLVLQRERQIQARWLIEAGIDRATARLRNDREYDGESWIPSASEIGSRWDGKVDIVAAATEVATRYRIHVTAIYPDQEGLRIREEQIAYLDFTDEAQAQ